MNSGDKTYIWQLSEWPHWTYDAKQLAPALGEVRLAQGHLLGRMHDLGMDVRDHATLRALTQDVLKTSEIEGENFPLDTVRSSVARRLGVDIGALAPVDRHVDGVVTMVLDATGQAEQPLTLERLLGWHAALFPTGYSGLSAIRVGALRDDAKGPMQVVSGPLHRQTVHYQAPPAHRLHAELSAFLQWFNADPRDDPVLKAGLAHLWLVTLHPFDDGNGRIARAVGDMALTRAERLSPRYYSLSAQIQRERKAYYDHLEATQQGTLDVTGWLTWFLGCLLRALQGAQEALSAVLVKAHFWQQWVGTPMNERQIQLLNKMLDGFDGKLTSSKLTSSKWAAVAKCSPDTALRDINDLIQRGILRKAEAGGRSIHYLLCEVKRK
jgi:Fic family protein